jgi:hypothetical protein
VTSATIYPRRRVWLGFLVGASAFALLSFASPRVWDAISDPLCALPAGRHFASASCVLGVALAAALWLGPAEPLFILAWPALRPVTLVPIASGLMVAALSAWLVARYGWKRGSGRLLLITVFVLLVLIVFNSTLVTSI